ncbi:hypothetical protein ACLI09_06110 [Flavobacterium sp. RHBU_24]|uniref:hypothetical protein n=1 Tax=Flavobacterium sp. RHBU_24 TaxID=3391185 RepID=UPI003984D9CC
MEDNYSTTSSFDNFELQFNELAKEHLKEAGKWAYFLSIIGFIGLGFIVLIAIFMIAAGSMISSLSPGMGALGAMGTGVLAFIYLVMVLLYFFPIMYLYRFGSRIKRAISDNNAEQLTAGLESLKSHYKYIGILTIVIMSMYALIFVFALLGAAVS